MSDEETELKRVFAEKLLANPGEPFQAAFAAIPDDPGRALQIAQLWANDFEVQQICEELKEKHGEAHFLPSKEGIAREVLDLGREKEVEAKTRLLAYRLVAEVMGFIEKPQTNINNNVNNNHRVMVVKDHGSDDDWEQKAYRQQERLIQDARTTTH